MIFDSFFNLTTFFVNTLPCNRKTFTCGLNGRNTCHVTDRYLLVLWTVIEYSLVVQEIQVYKKLLMDVFLKKYLDIVFKQ